MISRRRLLAPLRRRPARIPALVLVLALLWSLSTSTAAFSSSSGRGSTFASDSLDPPTGLSATRDCPTSPAPVWRSTASASSVYSTINGISDSRVSVAAPAGLQQSDVLIATVFLKGWDSVVAPSGWTALATDYAGASSTSYSRLAVFGRVATASEPTSYQFSWDTSDPGMASISAYSGATNVVESPAAQNTGYTNKPYSPSITTSTTPTLLVVAIGVVETSSLTAPSEVAVRHSRVTSSALLLNADQVLTATGTTGTRIFTNSTSQYGLGAALALRAPDPPPSTVALAWTATPDTYATGYELVRTGDTTTTTDITGRTTTSHTDSVTTRSTAYTYSLRAVSGTWRSTAATVSVGAC